MSRSNTGRLLLWLAAGWALIWGVGVGALFVNPAFRSMTMAELQETPWAPPGGAFATWAFAVPLAAIVGTIGALLRAGAPASTVWKVAAGAAVILGIAMAGAHGYLGHVPLVFAAGGTVILLSFFGILFAWADTPTAAEGPDRLAADLRLVGHLFFLLATWFVCGVASMPFLKAVEGLPTTSPIHSASSPIHVMIFFVLGWAFTLASYRVARRDR